MASYGSNQHSWSNVKIDVEWICERPQKLGGAWAVGSRFYEHLLGVVAQQRRKRAHEKASSASVRQDGQRINTQWGRCEVRSLTSMSTEHVKQHCQSEVHRLAMEVLFNPTAAIWTLGKGSCTTDPEDRHLLGGGLSAASGLG